jgi:RNA polymerase-binding transcription factor DksA
MTDRETPWEFLPDDDDIDSGGRSAEELAMHIERLRRPRRARDSGMSDVELGPPEMERPSGIGQFADEEPEHPEAGLVEERELDVWELLERQGYTFAEETEERGLRGLTEEKLPRWKRHLDEERQRLVELRSGADRELSSIDQHQADAASMTYELEAEQSLLRHIDDALGRVDDALERVETGSYGRCEMCGAPIGDERLRARPASRFCVAHEKLARGTRPQG